MLNPSPLILFLKARRPHLGQSMSDLFETTVPVKGYVNPKTGTYVAPTMARRKKRAPEVQDARPIRQPEAAPKAPRQADLFAPPDEAPRQKDLFDGLDESPQPEPQAAPKPTPTPARTRKPRAPSSLSFGIPAAATKKQRKAWNADALRLLREHPEGDPWSDDEKAILARYSGQGGVGDSLNEYYTRPDVATAMWSLLGNLGYTDGPVLEPSCGTGVFLHTAPAGASMVGVDLDPVSSRIAGILHGGEVHTQSAETFATIDPRTYRAVIGNCPFGPRGELIAADKPHLPTAQQYFLDMAIDKAEAGGLVAMIVPTGIMNGMNTRGYRASLLRKAEFVGAYRLPNSAFAHSHTAVTTDIVVFRAYPKDTAGALSVVTDATLEHMGLWDDAFVQGTYFDDAGRGHVFGTPEPGWRAKAGMGNDFTVAGSMSGVAEAIGAMRPSLRETLPTVPEVLAAAQTINDPAEPAKIKRAALKRAYEVAQVGDTKTVDGVTYRLEGEPPRWHRLGGEEAKPAALSDAEALAPLLAQLHRQPTDELRERVQERLAAYVAIHGIPAQNRDLLAEAKRLRGRGAARDLYRVIGAVNADGSFSDLVAGRASGADETSLDRVAERLSLERGGFTLEDLLEAWQGPGDREDAIDALMASRGYALEGDGVTWTTLPQYLTGHLWPKLDAARAMLDALLAEEIGQRAKLQGQIDALTETIAPKLLDEVEIDLRSGWLPIEALQAWLQSQVDAYREEHAGVSGANLSWLTDVTVSFQNGIYTITGGLNLDRIEKYLNREALRAKEDKPVIDEANAQYRDWLLASEWRESLEDRYNRTFRGFVKTTRSEAPLEIPGLNPAITDINAYHFAGLRWAIEAGKGIIAADVGLGKTPRGLMLGALARAHGQATKPTYVVPKSVLANWVVEAEHWFPGANVLVIGEEYARDAAGKLMRDANGQLKSKADSPDAKARKLAMLAQNQYDFVFISQPVWNEIDLDPITKGELLENDFWVQRGDALGNAGDKKIRQIRENYAQATAKRDFRERSGAVYFNDLGIDFLVLDEAHAYKNLFAIRARWGESPRFLGGGGLSNRAHDTDLKAAWFRAQHDDKGIFGLTATPTKNSPLEVYSMLHHIAPEEFDRIGIRNSEEFIDRFVAFSQGSYLNTTGEIDSGLICDRFKNLDELRPIMDRYIDRTTAADVGLNLPEKDVHEHLIPMTSQQQAIYAELRDAATGGGQDGNGEHIFRIIDQMSKAALDPSLLGYSDSDAPKIAAAVTQMLDGSKDGGQVVFCDYLAAHDRIRDELIKRGVDPKRIAICNAKAASSATQRQAIADRFNDGKLDFVIGNTATMGEGMNLQKRTTDIHHLDLPWEPASLQQRNGRGLRQGNRNERVRIHTYFAQGSFDGYRWQTLAAKRDWQDLLWNGGDTVENLAKQSNFSRSEMQILLSADPDAERAKLEGDAAAALARHHAEQQAEASHAFVRLQELKHSYAALRDKHTRSAAALEQRIRNETTRLRTNPHFTHKSALERTDPVLIHPDTGELWHVGVALEMDGSARQPIHWSGEPSRWVVDAVNTRDQTVRIRKYADKGDLRMTVALADLHHGVSQVPYDPEEERAQLLRAVRAASVWDAVGALGRAVIDRDRKEEVKQAFVSALDDLFTSKPDWYATPEGRNRARAQLMQVAHRAIGDADAENKATAAALTIYRSALFTAHGLPGVKSLKDLVGQPDATLHLLAPELQEHFRAGVRSYNGVEPMTGGGDTHWPMVTADGKLRLFVSFKGRKALDDHQVMLPTAENRAKAMAAALELERAKKIETNYVTTRGRTQASGLKCAYEQDREMGYDIKTNPWHSILRQLWGESAVSELNTAHQQAWRAELDQATNVSGVLKAMHFGLDNVYGKPTVSRALGRAVAAKLDQLGVLDQNMNAFHAQLAGEDKPSGAWGLHQSELLRLLGLGSKSDLIARNLLSHEWKQSPEG